MCDDTGRGEGAPDAPAVSQARAAAHLDMGAHVNGGGLGFTGSLRANERLRAVIPGGAHTYAKGLDQYPEGMAPVIARGKGAHVWDVDGNRYIEYGSGLRSVSLGHAHPRVNAAAAAAMELGTNFARPSLIEAEAAEKLLSILPRAEMVKFAKNGSDATTGAVRLA